MIYSSTRGGSETFSYGGASLQGLAEDRGLLAPETLPSLRLDEQTLRTLADVSHPELFAKVTGSYAEGSFTFDEMLEFGKQAYGPENFPKATDGAQEKVVPVRMIDDNLYVADLSEGPTASFKDHALQVVVPQMNFLLGKQDRKQVMFGASSGDTIGSAEDAVRRAQQLGLLMIVPDREHGSMTDFQYDQAAELTGGNIFNGCIPGDFDTCQELVKLVKSDPEFKDLGAVNSINWARIAAQVTYYVATYLQVCRDNIGQEIDVTVPTGNFGNILAGYMARKMGLPIRRLIVATNENDVLDTFIQTGVYAEKGPQAEQTSSPSIDITNASNLERVLLDVFGGDTGDLKTFMTTFESGSRGKRRASLADMGLPADTMLDMGFRSGSSNGGDRLSNILWAFRQGMLIDPHTADGMKVAREQREDGVPMVVMSTAKPVKFPETMRKALGFTPPVTDLRFQGLEQRAHAEGKGFTPLDATPEAVKKYLRETVMPAVLG